MVGMHGLLGTAGNSHSKPDPAGRCSLIDIPRPMVDGRGRREERRGNVHPAAGTGATAMTAAPRLSAQAQTLVREALVREAARFARLGWMRATSGNLSAVVSRDPLRLLVTASGR